MIQKENMKKYKVMLITILGILGAFIVLMILIKTGVLFSSARKIEGIESLGISFEDLTIPEDAMVVAIGEATHGNREFQTVKLEMLQKMVDEGNCHSISFEISVGEGAIINEVIHDPDSDIDSIVASVDYPIYDTQGIVDLLEWMKEYNTGRAYEDSVCFYGFDMQGSVRGIEFIATHLDELGNLITEEEKARITELHTMGEGAEYSDREMFSDIADRLAESVDPVICMADLCAGAVVQSIDAPSFEEKPDEYGEFRDGSMAANVMNIYELEAERGNTRILITAHNGHVMKGETLGYGEVAMGAKIDDLFDGKYFCVGTEFYNTTVNIHTAGTYDDEYERADHTYCSDDRLAYQAKFFDGGRYALVFSGITESDGKVYDIINNENFTGCAGEGYNIFMDIYKGYRVRLVAAERYDAMIYYYETTPIRCLHY